MRISRLSIDGFGIFRDVEVRDLSPGLSLFLGDNESGKSTTLGFVHTVLFGYPDGRTNEKVYPAHNGGQPGGRLVLETPNEGLLTLERREGKKGGTVTVTYSDGHTEGQPALSRLLGGTTRHLYRNLYGFSLHELERLESLTDEEVRDAIYGASLGGASARSFPEARKRVEARLADLFRPSGSKPEINNLLGRLKEVRDGVREAGRGIREYEALAAALSDQDGRILSAREGLRVNRERLERLKAHVQLWDDWTQLQDAEKRLAALPGTVEAFPENGLARIDQLAQQIETQKEELRRVEADLNEKHEKLKRLVFDDALLAKEAEIRALIRGLGAFEQALTDLPRADERLKSARRQVKEVLAEFGAAWTEERVRALDRSSMNRGRIEKHREALEAARRRVEKTSDIVEGLRTALEEAAKEDQRARGQVDRLQRGRIELAPETLAALRGRREQFHGVVRDIPKISTEHREAVATLQKILREINPAWTRNTLEEFDGSLTARQKVNEIDDRLGEAVAQERETRSALERAEKALAQAEEALKRKAKEIEDASAEAMPLKTLRERKGLIRSLRDALARREMIQSELRVRRQMAQAPRPVPSGGAVGLPERRLRAFAAVAAVLGVVAGPSLWFAVSPEVGATAGGLLLLTAITLFLLARSTSRIFVAPGGPPAPDDDETIRQLQADMQKVGSEITGLQTDLSVTEEIGAAGVDRLEDENAEQTRAAEELTRLRADLEDLEESRDRLAKEKNAAVTGVEAARARHETEEIDWKGLAQALKLSRVTSPRTAGLVFEKAETARGQARLIADLETRLEDMHAARDEYLDVMTKVPLLEAVAREGSDEQRLGALAEFLADMDRQEKDARLLADARLAAERAAQQLDTAKKKLDEASEEHRKAAAADQGIREDWADWLREHDMDETWSPDTCPRLLDRAVRLADVSDSRDEAADEAAQLAKENEDFLGGVAALCRELGRSEPPADKLVAEVHALESSLEEHSKRRTLHDGLADEIPTLQSRCANRRRRIEDLESEALDLVASGGAADEEEFRNRGRLFAERQRLLEVIETHAGHVKKISGESDLEALRVDLSEATLPMLKAALADAQGQVDEGESSLSGLQDERARTDERRKQLRDEDAIAKLRAEEESLLETFRLHADDWGRHAVALHLLIAAKERFEKAHQPEVIRQAGRYFSSITGGRYGEVFAPHGEEAIEVIDDHKRRKGLDALSRGTSEQLYLAIRFGYIASHDDHGEKLPILMDDVLVNFDPTRASQAARGILEMARDHQILFFTCHPQTVDVFRRHYAEIPVYKLADDDITGPISLPAPSSGSQ